METKTLNSREIAQIKRICQNVDSNFQKVTKLKAKAAELQKEIDELQADIDEMEAPVLRKTGFRSTDLVEKVVIPQMNPDGTPKVDKNGSPIKVTKYVLKYPDSIFPVGNKEVTVEDSPAENTEEAAAEVEAPKTLEEEEAEGASDINNFFSKF